MTQHQTTIATTPRTPLIGHLQEFIRSGGFAWPGGYQCALLMADGECIDAQAAREHYALIRRAMRDCDARSDWLPVAVFIHWEGAPLICAHSNRQIPSAYGEPDACDVPDAATEPAPLSTV